MMTTVETDSAVASPAPRRGRRVHVGPGPWLAAAALLLAPLTHGGDAPQPAPAAPIEKTKLELTQEGGRALAQQRLAQDRDDRVGRRLLEFLLALDPGDPVVRQVQAALQSGAAVPAPPADADTGPAYASLLLALSRQFPANEGDPATALALPFLAMAACVDPANEDAAQALEQARLEGAGDDLAALMEQLRAARTKLMGSGFFSVSVRKPAGSPAQATAAVAVTATAPPAAFLARARRLSEEFTRAPIDATARYRGKRVRISGEVTEISRSSRPACLDLDGGKVRIVLTEEAARNPRLHALQEKLAELLDYLAQTRRGRNAAYYYYEVTAVGECTGYREGKVWIEKAGDLEFTRQTR